jgi:hypothetical protein
MKQPLRMWRLFTKFLRKRSRKFHSFWVLRFFHAAFNTTSLETLSGCVYHNRALISKVESRLTKKAYFKELKAHA